MFLLAFSQVWKASKKIASYLYFMAVHTKKNAVTCYHCGEDCSSAPVVGDGKDFCCEGCKMVYSILNKNGMCDYYTISQNPGNSRKIKVRADKFAFLDDEKISTALLNYKDVYQT